MQIKPRVYNILNLNLLVRRMAAQEYKTFAFASVGGSPKLPSKFQATKLRNSIDSLRNIVVPLDTGKTLAENLKQQLQQ